MNWLATLISSLRDFTRGDSSLTRREASLHAATPPYTARQRLSTRHRRLTRPYGTSMTYTPEGPYTCRRHLTRRTAPLHAAPPPYTRRRRLYLRLRRLALLFVKKSKRFSYFTYFYSRVPIKLLILQRLCNNAWPARSITRGPAAHLKT